ncbi:MAG: hypothetical protein QW645_03630 [Candidatus Bathyarchaeia archaeon]
MAAERPMAWALAAFAAALGLEGLLIAHLQGMGFYPPAQLPTIGPLASALISLLPALAAAALAASCWFEAVSPKGGPMALGPRTKALALSAILLSFGTGAYLPNLLASDAFVVILRNAVAIAPALEGSMQSLSDAALRFFRLGGVWRYLISLNLASAASALMAYALRRGV